MSLVQAGSIRLPPGGRPGFDHADTFVSGGRLYLAHTGADRVDVIDCADRVSVFRCTDEALLGRAAVGPHPNGLAYDRRRQQLYSFNLGDPPGENCTASIVRLDPVETIDELQLPGRPRWAVYDEGRDRIYANIRDSALVVVIDPERRAIERSFEVASDGPHGLWQDAGRLYCAAD